MKNVILLLWVGLVAFSVGYLAVPVYAQESCGNIITYYDSDWDEDGVNDSDIEQIKNCNAPFGVASGNPDLTISFGTTEITEGGVYPWSGVTGAFTIQHTIPEANSSYLVLYKHQGQDYVAFYPELDAYTFTEPGTYTAVMYEDQFILTQNFIQKIFSMLIPTAYAFPGASKIITFEVTEVPQEPQGASSVLFLPGMQASRLYTDGILGTENQLWEPNRNNDTELLTMNSDGESLEHVYTRDVVDSIPLVGTVYEGFISFLEERKGAPFPIKEYSAFAYDWRYSVTDIAEKGTQYEEGIKSLVGEVDRLAVDSYTKKVTIIAHSNGGLLAKALLTHLETLGKAEKIDKVILLASPQLGTPKAIATVLHGYDQKLVKGLILNPHDARILVHNMPGVYGLLPSEKYFDTLGDPLISFDDSSIVEPYVERYGTSIDSYDEYVEFMQGDGWSSRSLESAVSNPAETNGTLFDDAQAMHGTTLDSWHAPTGVEVVEIVGTGLPTVKGIEYTGVIEGRTCGLMNGVTTCVDNVILKPYVQLTKYGDQTVVQRSAEAYDGAKKKFFVNLGELRRNIPESRFEHYNISEIEQVQELIQAIILATTTGGIRFVSEEYTAFDDAYDVEIIDSPVRMVAEDSEGRQTGVVVKNGEAVIREDIPGSQYIYLGDTKYLVIPKGTDHTTTLYGEAEGHFTLTTAVLDQSDTQIMRTRMENVTTTPTMVAQYTEKQDVYTSIRIDNEGDGVIDAETDLNGKVLHALYTYADLYQAIHALTLKKSFKKILIQEVSRAERVGKLKIAPTITKRLERIFLEQVMKTVRRYEHKRLITATEAGYIVKIIQSLIDKK